MTDFSGLQNDHDEMDALADRLVSAARAPDVPGATCVALIQALMRTIAAHRAREAPILASGPAAPARDRLARESGAYGEAFAAILESVADYVAAWDAAAIRADRTGFAQATLDMMTAFKHCIAQESSLLYPLARAMAGPAAANARAALPLERGEPTR